MKNNDNLISQIEKCFVEENEVTEKTMKVNDIEFSIFYIESLIDKKMYSSSIFQSLDKICNKNCKIGAKNAKKSEKYYENEIFSKLKDNISVPGTTEESDCKIIVKDIFSGFCAIVFDKKAIVCPIFGVEKRSIDEPPSSKVLKGPREGFVEDIFTNTGLVRKRLKTASLKIKTMNIGKRSGTTISLFYIDGVAKLSILKKIEDILSKIDIDGIIDSYYIESFLEGNKLKFFKRVGSTEKPDIFCAKILEGRVGIIVDGSPIALTAPFVLIEDFQSAGDYYAIPAIASFTRIMRLFGLFIAVFAPAIYVSLQSYNYRILPINFLITLLSSVEGLSVPPLLEILLVLFLFEIIAEASVRMPDALGMALSIVGALALGNTAVDAGIISPPSIVIVAISSVALHIIPDGIAEMRIMRLLFTTIGGIVGLYGVFVGVIILLTYLCSIESFGSSYLSPYTPNNSDDKKDGFIMKPLQEMKNRPFSIAGDDKKRQGENK